MKTLDVPSKFVSKRKNNSDFSKNTQVGILRQNTNPPRRLASGHVDIDIEFLADEYLRL